MSLFDTLYALFIHNRGKIFLRHTGGLVLLTVSLTFLTTLLQDANYFMFFLLFAGALISSGFLLVGRYHLSMRITAWIVLGMSATLISIMFINTYVHGFALERHFPIWTPTFLFVCSYLLYCMGITTYKKAPK